MNHTDIPFLPGQALAAIIRGGRRFFNPELSQPDSGLSQ